MSGMIQVNNVWLPAPDKGMGLVIATAVNAKKNAQGTLVGQKVGRDQYKIDSLQWSHLTAEQWATILQAFNDFFVDVRFPDPVNNDWITLRMYPGDRTGSPGEVEPEYFHDGAVNPRAWLPKTYLNCKVNIIDCGVID